MVKYWLAKLTIEILVSSNVREADLSINSRRAQKNYWQGFSQIDDGILSNIIYAIDA